MASPEEDPLSAIDIFEPIGQGISGTVYKGLWRREVVAVKVMEQVLDKHQAVQEAAVCMAIRHPSVVQTHLYVLKQLPAAQQYLDRVHGLPGNRQAAELSPGSCQEAFRGDHAVAHGTLTYMPPELLLHGTVSCAVDVYSLSVLLWEMYTGQQPYKGLTEAQIVDSKAEGCRSLPLPSSCPSPYVQLCNRCLEFNPCLR
ncbi:hypothetical protein WJX79_002568 [Trebouxia sp. C0005]